MNAYSEKPEAIDWDHYRGNISKPNFVEDFKKQFEALAVPYPKDTATTEIESLQKKTVKCIECIQRLLHSSMLKVYLVYILSQSLSQAM